MRKAYHPNPEPFDWSNNNSRKRC